MITQITAAQESKIFRSYAYGEIDLPEALKLSGYSEHEFLGSYKIWIGSGVWHDYRA